MPNSATLVQALLAAFCAILCALSGMGGGGMMLGARTAAWAAKSGGWVNPYVTAGLVAMWDGEWNAGGGVHDSVATKWPDLIGGISFNMHGVTWGTDRAYFDGSGYGEMDDVSSGKMALLRVAPMSFEIVFKYDKTKSGQNSIFCMGEDHIASILNGIFYFRGYSDNVDVNFRAPFCYGNVSNTTDARSVTVTSYPNYSSDMRIFEDSTEKTFTSFSSRPVSNYGLPKIGCVENSNGVKSNFLGGELMCIRLYNRTLTAEEVAANYAIDKARFGLPETT